MILQAKYPSLETNVINRVESTEPQTDLGAQTKQAAGLPVNRSHSVIETHLPPPVDKLDYANP